MSIFLILGGTLGLFTGMSLLSMFELAIWLKNLFCTFFSMGAAKFENRA